MFPSQHFDERASCGEMPLLGQENTKRLQRESWSFSRLHLVVQWLQTHHWEQLPRSVCAQQNRTTAQESDRNGITGGLKENGEMVF